MQFREVSHNDRTEGNAQGVTWMTGDMPNATVDPRHAREHRVGSYCSPRNGTKEVSTCSSCS